jgi:hypothetical protein
MPQARSLLLWSICVGLLVMNVATSALAEPPPMAGKGLKYVQAKLTKVEKDNVNKEYKFTFDDGGKKPLGILRTAASTSWESPPAGGKKHTLTAQDLAKRFNDKKASRDYWLLIREKGRLIESVVPPAASASWTTP